MDKKITIAIGSDRRGFLYKSKIIKKLSCQNYCIIDVGPYDDKFPVDYPIYGFEVGKLISKKEADFGIVICATGIGIMIACNKVDGVRCGIAYNKDIARLMREHNDANVIAFGQDHLSLEEVFESIDIFLNTKFLKSYHSYRIEQITQIEKGEKLVQSKIISKI